MLAMVLHLLAHLHQLRMQQLQQTRRGGASSESNSPIIQFKDPNLKKALLAYMKENKYITDQNATEITEAQAGRVVFLGSFHSDPQENALLKGKGITDITGLQYFTGLVQLDLSCIDITDISPLENLKLGWLSLDSDKNITDFSPLAKMPTLAWLSCRNTNISDLSPFKGVKRLWGLFLDNNQISNISPLKDLPELGVVHLSHNQITDISPLKDLSSPETVNLSYNQITDFSPINSNITDELNLDGNPIKSLAPISKLTKKPAVGLEDMEITHKVSASTIDLSTLWPYAQYCTFSFEPLTDDEDDNSMKWEAVTSQPVGTIQGKTFTLKSLPPEKKVTLHFMVVKNDLPRLLTSLGVKDADNYEVVYYRGKLVLDYSSEEEPQVAPLYRLYNPYTHEHFFTAETVENDNLVRLGWKSEGGVGYIYKRAEKGGVYRLYNPTTGEHHYTMNEDEVATCVKDGWKNEGVKWFSAQDKDKKLNKLYSMYNPYEKKFYHHYTADAKEIAEMVKAGWRKEEVKWCTLPQCATR